MNDRYFDNRHSNKINNIDKLRKKYTKNYYTYNTNIPVLPKLLLFRENTLTTTNSTTSTSNNKSNTTKNSLRNNSLTSNRNRLLSNSTSSPYKNVKSTSSPTKTII